MQDFNRNSSHVSCQISPQLIFFSMMMMMVPTVITRLLDWFHLSAVNRFILTPDTSRVTYRRGPSVLSVRLQTPLGRPSLPRALKDTQDHNITSCSLLIGFMTARRDPYLTLPAARVNLDFRGNHSFQRRLAPRGVPACRGVRGALEGPGCCCGTCRWGSGSVTC